MAEDDSVVHSLQLLFFTSVVQLSQVFRVFCCRSCHVKMTQSRSFNQTSNQTSNQRTWRTNERRVDCFWFIFCVIKVFFVLIDSWTQMYTPYVSSNRLFRPILHLTAWPSTLEYNLWKHARWWWSSTRIEWNRLWSQLNTRIKGIVYFLVYFGRISRTASTRWWIFGCCINALVRNDLSNEHALISPRMTPSSGFLFSVIRFTRTFGDFGLQDKFIRSKAAAQSSITNIVSSSEGKSLLVFISEWRSLWWWWWSKERLEEATERLSSSSMSDGGLFRLMMLLYFYGSCEGRITEEYLLLLWKNICHL